MAEGGVESRLLLSESSAAERSRISKLQGTGQIEAVESPFTVLLRSGCRTNDFEPFLDHLQSLNPSKADLEIRSLRPRTQDGYSELSVFVTALTGRLKLKRDFELVNAWMAVFLKVHGEIVMKCSDQAADEYTSLREALALWSQTQEQEAKRLAGLVGYCRGIAGFLRSSR